MKLMHYILLVLPVMTAAFAPMPKSRQPVTSLFLGKKSKPASSPEEDLELTRQVIAAAFDKGEKKQKPEKVAATAVSGAPKDEKASSESLKRKVIRKIKKKVKKTD